MFVKLRLFFKAYYIQNDTLATGILIKTKRLLCRNAIRAVQIISLSHPG